MRTEKENFAIAGLVCGILGIVGCWLPYVNNFTFIFSVLGIVFGVMTYKHVQGNYRTMSIAGIICGILGVVIAVVAMLIILLVFGGMFAIGGMAMFGELAEEMSYATASLI